MTECPNTKAVLGHCAEAAATNLAGALPNGLSDFDYVEFRRAVERALAASPEVAALIQPRLHGLTGLVGRAAMAA